MPLFMDVHNMDGGVSCDAVRDAHAKDVAIQGDHGVNYKSYWVSEAEGKIFCLVEAPTAEGAATLSIAADPPSPTAWKAAVRTVMTFVFSADWTVWMALPA